MASDLTTESGRNQTNTVAGPQRATVVLAAVLGFAALIPVMGVVLEVVHPKPIALLSTTQRQGAETALFLVAFGVCLPAGIVVARRIVQAAAKGPNADAIAPIALVLATGLALAIVIARAADALSVGGGPAAAAVVTAVWWVGAAWLLSRAVGGRPLPGRDRLVAREPVLVMAAGVALLAALLCIVHAPDLSLAAVAVTAIAAVIGTVALVRIRVPALRGRWGPAVDVIAVLVMGAAVCNLAFVPVGMASGFSGAFRLFVVQFHNTFYLGAANQVIGGAPMLAGTVSQYGVGSIYAVVAWFKLTSISYAALSVFDGLLTALFYMAAYAVVRICGVPRLLAIGAFTVAVGTLVFNLAYPVGLIPQDGPLRFGPPMGVLVAFAIAYRWPRWSRYARASAFVVLAIASLWAFEAFVYTLGVLAAMVAVELRMLPGDRLRTLVRTAAIALASCVVAQVLFALATLAASGDLPDWGLYLGLVKAFLGGDIGEVTYDFSSWSPGLAVGAAYLASASAVAVTLFGRRKHTGASVTTLVLTAGTTVYGILMFAYFVNRSLPSALPYVSLPVVMLGAIWLNEIRRADPGIERPQTLTAFGFGFATAAVALTVAWPNLRDGFDRSALGYAMPGGESVRSAVQRLKHLPSFDARSAFGAALLRRYMPGERRSVVLLSPYLDTDVLLAARRSNSLPLPNPTGDSYALSVTVPPLERAIAKLRPGRRILIDRDQLVTLRNAKEHPGDLATTLETRNRTGAAPIQQRAMLALDRRFRLTVIARAGVFRVVELRRR